MNDLGWQWLVSAVVIFFILCAIGVGAGKGWYGVLVDKRRKMSLSRFQMTMWTWVLVSVTFAVGFVHQTMNIQLDPQLWALLGITVGSTATAVIVKGHKADNDLHTHSGDKGARWIDMFMGEEKVNDKYVDIGKVQMFFFTIAVLIGYIWLLWNWSSTPVGGQINLPVMSEDLVTFLGISHAGYITIKAAPKGKTVEKPDGASE